MIHACNSAKSPCLGREDDGIPSLALLGFNSARGWGREFVETGLSLQELEIAGSSAVLRPNLRSFPSRGPCGGSRRAPALTSYRYQRAGLTQATVDKSAYLVSNLICSRTLPPNAGRKGAKSHAFTHVNANAESRRAQPQPQPRARHVSLLWRAHNFVPGLWLSPFRVPLAHCFSLVQSKTGADTLEK